MSASGLVDKQVGHKYFKQTPSEGTSDESRTKDVSQTQDGDTQPSRRLPDLVAPVDECDYTLHGSAENLYEQEKVASEHKKLGHETSLNHGP